MPRTFNYILIFIMLPFAGLAQYKINMAPINPDFIQYQKGKSSKLKSLILVDSVNGYVPPVMLLPESFSTENEFNESTLSSSSPSIPSKYDLRSLKYVTSVKNQGKGKNGGNCWTFACMGAIESNWLTKGLGEYDLSEQNLVTCHGFLWGYGEGGNEYTMMGYLSRLRGPVLESQIPYDFTKQFCISDTPKLAYVPETRWVYRNHNLTKRIIMDYGAVTTPMFWDNKSFNSDDNTYYYGGTSNANHAVLIVGWDDTKKTAGGTGAWIVKNQWTMNWGERGYFYISYKDSKILNPVTFYPVRWEKRLISGMFYYDNVGVDRTIGFNQETGTVFFKYSFKYTKIKRMYIKKVGTFLATTGADVTIEILSDSTGIYNNSYNYLSKFKCDPVPAAGFYTFDVPTLVTDSFYIKVTYKTPGYNLPIPIEMKIENFSDPYIYSTGLQWIIQPDGKLLPIGRDTDNQANLVLHAYVSTNTGPKPNFSMSKYQVCSGSSIVFTNQSVGTGIVSYFWDFGKDANPATATGPGPHAVSFADTSLPGLRNAKLKISWASGSDSIIKEYKVVDQLNMMLLVPSKIILNDTISLSAAGDADIYTWTPSGNLNASTGKDVLFSTGVQGKYMVKVTGNQGNCTGYKFATFEVKVPPKNDNICDAIELHLGENGPFNNTNATVEVSEPYPTVCPDDSCCNTQSTWCDEGGLQNSIWFKFTGPASGIASFDTKGFDEQIAVYKANDCKSVRKENLVAANDDYHQDNYAAAIVKISVIPGDTYFLQVDGSQNGVSGTFYITLYDSSFTGGGKKDGTSVETISENENFSIAPNPTKGLFNLRYYSDQSEMLNILITDLAGKQITLRQLKKPTGIIEREYNLNGLSKGMYFVTIKGNNSAQTRKLVIQ
jgi:C1A family cysteine protease